MPATETSPGARLLNRELSWLDFNERVLAMAERDDVPLLERAKFLAIYSQNLDEFFQVRVAGLKDQVAAGITASTPDGRTPAQQLLEIRDVVEKLSAPSSERFSNTSRLRSAESASSSARTRISTRTTSSGSTRSSRNASSPC